MICLKLDYKQVAAFGEFLFKKVNYIDKIEDLNSISKNSVFYFSNPGNPSCKYYSSIDMISFIRKDIPIIIDLAYEDFYDDFNINNFKDFNNVLFTKTFSKFYGMAGARLAYFIFNINSPLNSFFNMINANGLEEIIFSS